MQAIPGFSARRNAAREVWQNDGLSRTRPIPRPSLATSLLVAALLPLSALAQVEETPAMERAGGSVQAPGGTVVLPPLPITPMELLSEDRRASRAGQLLLRIEVLDTFAARLARQSRRVLGADPVDCAAMGTLHSALVLVQGGSELAGRTVNADLAILPDSPALTELRERASQATQRRVEVTDESWPALHAALLRRCPALKPGPPTPWLPVEDRMSVDGYSVIFVKTERPGAVVWSDGAPAAVSDDAGWATLVAPGSPLRLCEAAPADERCDELVELDPRPAAAFDLSR